MCSRLPLRYFRPTPCRRWNRQEPDEVKIEYCRSADGLTWTQNVTNALTSAYLSCFAHASGPMTGHVISHPPILTFVALVVQDLMMYICRWGTGTECDNSCLGTIAPQTYKNTQITLAGSNFNFRDTLVTTGGTTYTDQASSSSGSLWSIATITVPAMV